MSDACATDVPHVTPAVTSDAWANGVPRVTPAIMRDIARLKAERFAKMACAIERVTRMVATNVHGKPGCQFVLTDDSISDCVFLDVDITFLRRLNTATGAKPKFVTVGKFGSLQQEQTEGDTNPMNQSIHMSRGVASPKPTNGRPTIGFSLVAQSPSFIMLEDWIVAAHNGNKPNLGGARCAPNGTSVVSTSYTDVNKTANKTPVQVPSADELVAKLEELNPKLLDFIEESTGKKRLALPAQLLALAASSNGDRDIRTLFARAGDKQQLAMLPAYFSGEYAVRCVLDRCPCIVDSLGRVLSDKQIHELECMGSDTCARATVVLCCSGYTSDKGLSIEFKLPLVAVHGFAPYSSGYAMHIEPIAPANDEPPPKRQCGDDSPATD